jgi:hypothetical protein
MGRRGSRDRQGPPPSQWETERTLAAAEQDAGDADGHLPSQGDCVCACGNGELLLDAFLRVEGGVIDPEPIEVESLTCPECGREYEAIQVEGGRVARGELLGQTNLDE